jgi:hypothetical protein
VESRAQYDDEREETEVEKRHEKKNLNLKGVKGKFDADGTVACLV